MAELPSATDAVTYSVAEDLARVRAFVGARAAALGLRAYRVQLLMLAVSELATNTLQHTTAGGEVRIFAEDRQVVCEVTDQGGERAAAAGMPAAESLRGRGLAIVARVCDEVTTLVGPRYTLVRLRMNL